MSPILCPHCGTANRAGSYFCNRCGANLRAEQGPLPSPAPAAPTTATDNPPPADSPPEQAETPLTQEQDAQPWLQPGFVGPDDAPGEAFDQDDQEDVDADLAENADIPVAAGRLVSGIQGLIEPIRVATVPGEGDGEPRGDTASSGALDADRLRRVRMLMAEEPLLASAQPLAPVSAARLPLHPAASLWLPWVFLLIGVVAAIPVFWQLTRPTGTARQWPGVQEAFAVVDGLNPQATIQVLWAYDPGTAGELDLVAAPLVRHLLDKGARLEVVSLLPNGPATARRLLAVVHDERRQLSRNAGEVAVEPPRFLPGGVLALPSLGAQPAELAIVFAAQADDVQGWLEQVAPRNGVPVIAATGAGADPSLRPYLASGQLVGLVSGYDGAATYTTLLEELPARSRERQLQLQLVGQNLAAIVFFFLILIGNLSLLVNGRRSDG